MKDMVSIERTGKAEITHIPLEICNMIATYLENDQKALYTLLFVSKNFLNEACRLLYREIYIRKDQTRNRLPLSNPQKRHYYGSLVRSLTIESRLFYRSIRPILFSTPNLKELHLIYTEVETNVSFLLRVDYPFQLEALTVHAPPDAKLQSFVKAQPRIRMFAWDSYIAFPSKVNLLPEVASIKVASNILNSEWFYDQRTVRHVWAALGWVDFHPSVTEASRRVTSLRFTDGSSLYVQAIIGMFPNLRYLDVRKIYILHNPEITFGALRFIKKLRISSRLLETLVAVFFAKCPHLDSLVVHDDEGFCTQYRRDGAKLYYPENGETEWMEW